MSTRTVPIDGIGCSECPLWRTNDRDSLDPSGWHCGGALAYSSDLTCPAPSWCPLRDETPVIIRAESKDPYPHKVTATIDGETREVSVGDPIECDRCGRPIEDVGALSREIWLCRGCVSESTDIIRESEQ